MGFIEADQNRYHDTMRASDLSRDFGNLPAPTIVGTKANTIGVIRSFCVNNRHVERRECLDICHTFLPEYQPHTRTVIAATAPPGVERIKVCRDLCQISAQLPCSTIRLGHTCNRSS
jgi:hypothetical protein